MSDAKLGPLIRASLVETGQIAYSFDGRLTPYSLAPDISAPVHSVNSSAFRD